MKDRIKNAAETKKEAKKVRKPVEKAKGAHFWKPYGNPYTGWFVVDERIWEGENVNYYTRKELIELLNSEENLWAIQLDWKSRLFL